MPSELAAKIVSEMGSLPATWANTIDAELQEVREVLEGLLEFSDQVIEAFEITPLPVHRICIERARALMAQLRVDGAS